MTKTYKGKYKVRDRGKYVGDPDNVTYRSHWERQFFRWCEKNPKVLKWGSEVVVIPYYDPTSDKLRRYFMDAFVQFDDGSKHLIEIKPDKQTRPPANPKRKTQKYLNEVNTFIVNQSKWNAAEDFAKKRGMEFSVWTEHTFKAVGIKLLT